MSTECSWKSKWVLQRHLEKGCFFCVQKCPEQDCRCVRTVLWWYTEVSCSVRFRSHIVSHLRCVAGTLVVCLIWLLQLLGNLAKHSRPDHALQAVEQGRILQKCKVVRGKGRKESWIFDCVWGGFDQPQSRRVWESALDRWATCCLGRLLVEFQSERGLICLWIFFFKY